MKPEDSCANGRVLACDVLDGETTTSTRAANCGSVPTSRSHNTLGRPERPSRGHCESAVPAYLPRYQTVRQDLNNNSIHASVMHADAPAAHST